MDNSSLKQRLERLECHFTWDLGQHRNELQGMKRKMQNVDQETCTWLVHCYNLLGYIHQTLGSNTEAVKHLHKAESVIQEQGTEEAGVQLQVNKANLAWVYFHLGEMDKSKGYLEEVERLQRMHPAPPGCTLHPEVSGEKGWTLVKFNKSKKRQAIDYFKMALNAEPDRKEWFKGLAIAMSRAYIKSEFTPELEADILEQVKTASEMDPNDLFLQSLYILKKSEVQAKNNDEEVQSFLERTLSTGNLVGLDYVLEYFKLISIDRAIQEGQRVREKFPTSAKVLKILADVYKCKVFSMKEDSQERKACAQKGIKLFEEVVRDYPDCVRGRLSLATLHRFAHNTKRADEIYQQLLSEEDDLPPHTQQLLYYSYSCHLYQRRRSRDQSIDYLMKAAAIQNISQDRQKSIRLLKKTVENGRNSRCEEISKFLKIVLKDE
ncbi:interferon-induced protein with tetratricopeptide repeats 1-like [Rhinichthys klamathensis goyatoka]|uniref:interferon-induced protein with tetratricopeptide repeats 1-like n=1 Tax=Rhinichthys klamathensis goyatoka TaxID=3034132 RepID=UPI0024B52875|nr:interferon-induced protein with tetratricopeptide repeats 1-like [Rhinichthys klamathensis goyatoka]